VVMRQIKDSKTLAAAGADKEDGRRPTIVSAPAAAWPSSRLRRVRAGRSKIPQFGGRAEWYGACQEEPLTWRRALSGPKPQGSRTLPAPPSFPRSAASLSFSSPAPETNWTKLALKTLVKHERLARYRRCVCQGASGGQGSRPGFGRHAILAPSSKVPGAALLPGEPQASPPLEMQK